jgi:hypothetical protein
MTELWGLVVGAEASRGYIPYAGEDATQQAERVWPNNIGTVLGVLYSLSKEEIKRRRDTEIRIRRTKPIC